MTMKKYFIVPIVPILFVFLKSCVCSTPSIIMSPDDIVKNLEGKEYVYEIKKNYPIGTMFFVQESVGEKKALCTVVSKQKLTIGDKLIVKIGVDINNNGLLILRIPKENVHNYKSIKFPRGHKEYAINSNLEVGSSFFTIKMASQRDKIYYLSIQIR